MTNGKPEVHVFDPEIAAKMGVAGAILFHHVVSWTANNELRGQKRNFKDGRFWTYDPLDKWVENFPYLSRPTIYKHLRRLQAEGFIRVGCFNPLPLDKTRWYAVGDAANLSEPSAVKDYLDRKKIRFRIEHACDFGLTEAVLMANLGHWMHKNRRLGQPPAKDGRMWRYMSPGSLSRILPFLSRTQIKRVLRGLADKGVLLRRRQPDRRDHRMLYAFQDEARFAVAYTKRKREIDGYKDFRDGKTKYDPQSGSFKPVESPLQGQLPPPPARKGRGANV